MAELTVLYDEGCGFCRRVALWVARPPRVEIAPIGSPAGELLLRDLTKPERYATMHVVDAIGRRPVGRRRPGVARSGDPQWRTSRQCLSTHSPR